jgi:hypothetical protein
VTDGDAADVALVLALEGGQPGMFLAELGERAWSARR